METNFLILFGTALIPLVVGALWYSNALFGKAWFKASGMTEEKMKSGNMILILGLTYFLGLLLSGGMMTLCIHQFSTQGLFATQPGFAEGTGPYFDYFQNFIALYGDLHRSFGHGVVHGLIASITIALPLISIGALFERRGWKYIFIHWGYWIVTMILMGGIVSQFV